MKIIKLIAFSITICLILNISVFATETTDYTFYYDDKTIKLNVGDIPQVDVREDIYPKNPYYVTYYTNQANCPKCILGTNKTNDFYTKVKKNIYTRIDYYINTIKIKMQPPLTGCT